MEQAATPSSSARGRLIAEVAVVLAALWLPTFWAGIWRVVAPPPVGSGAVDHFYFAIYYAGRLAVLLFILAGTKEGFEHFGFDRFRARYWGLMAAAAAAVFLAILVVAGLFLLARVRPLPAAVAGPRLPADQAAWLFLVSVPVLASWQEVLFRGYLLTRLVDLWGPHWQAVASAALMGALWYVDRGASDMAVSLATGIVLGAFYLRVRSIWPVLGAHVAISAVFAAYALHHYR